ncbi:hypothetical protein CLU79DRAFT_737837 [Phycomyces nitens]|nr:hypothetical protein CLU79DRAFT_737837 [Phycomyces nitens]
MSYRKADRMTETGKWDVKWGTWAKDEVLMMEKRVKKLCRRNGMSMDKLRHFLETSEPEDNIEFWWKIAKKFPDRTLFHIVKLVNRIYCKKNYKGRWTSEEDKELLNLFGIYGPNFKEIEQNINRSAEMCAQRVRILKHKSGTEGQRWTDAETDLLIKAIQREKMVSDGRVSFEHISQMVFKGKRSPTQCSARWSAIRSSYKEGTLEKQSLTGNTPEAFRAQIMLLERLKKQKCTHEIKLDFSKVQDKEYHVNRLLSRKFYFKARTALPNFEKRSLDGE